MYKNKSPSYGLGPCVSMLVLLYQSTTGWMGKQQIFKVFNHLWSIEVLDKREKQGPFPRCEDREF